MNKDISHIRELLFVEMELAVSTTIKLIEKIGDDQRDFRPHDSMWSLIELVRHLVQVPALELAILQEKNKEDVRNLTKTIMHLREVASLSDVVYSGFQELKMHMKTLDETDFLYKGTAPFFAKDQPAVQVKWLIEIMTHIYHHRGQMFTYMKQLGIPVTMYDLYGSASES